MVGAPVGERVVIVGGGLTGCEIAYDLILKGKQPIIVEMKNDLIAARACAWPTPPTCGRLWPYTRPRCT